MFLLHGKLELLTVRLPANHGGEAQDINNSLLQYEKKGVLPSYLLGVKSSFGAS